LQIHIASASTANELDMVFATFASARADALLIAPDGFFFAQSAHLAALAARYAIPASHESRDFPAVGGLMSYGGSSLDPWRQAGVYVARVLNGEKPGDLPVMQPTKFEMAINLKTAEALGIEVPERLKASADELIKYAPRRARRISAGESDAIAQGPWARCPSPSA
jgi:putative tryptophan/tyrosine transport system substrate-binding protein